MLLTALFQVVQENQYLLVLLSKNQMEKKNVNLKHFITRKLLFNEINLCGEQDYRNRADINAKTSNFKNFTPKLKNTITEKFSFCVMYEFKFKPIFRKSPKIKKNLYEIMFSRFYWRFGEFYSAGKR